MPIRTFLPPAAGLTSSAAAVRMRLSPSRLAPASAPVRSSRDLLLTDANSSASSASIFLALKSIMVIVFPPICLFVLLEPIRRKPSVSVAPLGRRFRRDAARLHPRPAQLAAGSRCSHTIRMQRFSRAQQTAESGARNLDVPRAYKFGFHVG